MVRRPSNFSAPVIGEIGSPQPLLLVWEMGIRKKEGSLVWCGEATNVAAQPCPSLCKVRGRSASVDAACITSING